MEKDVFIPKNRRLPVLAFYKLEKPRNKALSLIFETNTLPYLTDKLGKNIKKRYHTTDLKNLYFDFTKQPKKSVHELNYNAQFNFMHLKPLHVSHINVYEVSFDQTIARKENETISAYDILKLSGHLKMITSTLKKNPQLEFELIVGDFRRGGKHWEYKEYQYNEKKTKTGTTFVKDESSGKNKVIPAAMIYLDHHHEDNKHCQKQSPFFSAKPTPPENYPIQSLKDAKSCVFKGKPEASSELGFVSYKLGDTRHVIGYNILNVGS